MRTGHASGAEAMKRSGQKDLPIAQTMEKQRKKGSAENQKTQRS